MFGEEGLSQQSCGVQGLCLGTSSGVCSVAATDAVSAACRAEQEFIEEVTNSNSSSTWEEALEASERCADCAGCTC